jgi:hypothetical protein
MKKNNNNKSVLIIMDDEIPVEITEEHYYENVNGIIKEIEKEN